MNIYDRLVTFEGAEHLCTQTAVNSGWVAAKIQKACDAIVRHALVTSNGQEPR